MNEEIYRNQNAVIKIKNKYYLQLMSYKPKRREAAKPGRAFLGKIMESRKKIPRERKTRLELKFNINFKDEEQDEMKDDDEM